MKKLILSIAVILLTLNVNAQNQEYPHQQNFIATVYDNVDLLIGTKVYPSNLSLPEYGYGDFYTKPDKKRHYGVKKKKDRKSPYSSLNKIEFIVKSATPNSSRTWILELENTSTSELVYFEYKKPWTKSNNSDSELSFYEIPNAIYSAEISSRKDRLEDKITYSTPYGEFVSFTKVVRGTDTVVYLTLSTYGSTLNVLEKGATILFTDGTQLKFPNIDIKTKAHTASSLSGYDYSIFKSLTAEEIEMFSTKTIEYFKLYIYDREINEKDSKKYNAYMNLLK